MKKEEPKEELKNVTESTNRVEQMTTLKDSIAPE